ncbi:TPA: hypothetical protein SIC78_001228 [Pasteurella multocida]|uniref:hypothetical protein n=1 Tax=Pasteurella multocida TaxID=747 RepID=UPI00299FED05|nr:hypothetical protein [Pasteurella multocida]HEH9668987.1 hypothetical protein [Pasteurella multocida]HEH9696341.1 hypothetical protein [Pasteurella multocida]HEH9752579.1 hypothetical protein [Pasteurella multocida]HEH9757142.1 hypothetical protein [Pasteurella multocida]
MAYSNFEKSEMSRITQLVLAELSKEDISKIHSTLKRLGLERYLVWETDNEELIESFSILPLEQSKKDIRFSQDYWLLLFAKWRFILHGKYCFHHFDDLQKNSSSEIQRYIDAHVLLLSLNAFVGSVPLWHPHFQMPSPFLLESGEEFWGFGGYPA